MKRFLKTTAMLAASITTIGLLSGCGDAAVVAPEIGMIGTWVQTEDVVQTEQGMSVTIKDGRSEYRKDGTSSGSATMVMGGLPEDLAEHKISGESTWSVKDGQLIDTVQTMTVTSASGTAQSVGLAKQIQASMPMGLETAQEIISLDKKTLVLKDPKSGLVMTYARK